MVTSAPAQAITGAGDLTLYDLKAMSHSSVQWLAGVVVRLPTARDSSLGSGKYSVGPALGYQVRSGLWTLGFFSQDYFSIIGPSSRAGVGRTKIDPIANVNLSHDWSVGFSTMSMTYDWVRNKWIEVPVGMRVTRRFGRSGLIPGVGPVEALQPLQASFEAEQNLSNVRAAPGWTTRLNVRWTF